MSVRRVITGCVLAIGLLSGCIVSFGPKPASQPALDVTQMPGTWVSGDGASITFTSAGTFTASRLDYGRAMIPTCGVVSGSGTWQLDGGTDANLVSMFLTQVSSPADGCTGFLQMTSWDTGSTPRLCAQQDPDNPCNGYIFTKQNLEVHATP